jgi:hypothetical protein
LFADRGEDEPCNCSHQGVWQEGATEDAAVQKWSTQNPTPHRVEVDDAIPEKQEKQPKKF